MSNPVDPIQEPVFKSSVPSPLLEMCKDTDDGHIRRFLLNSQSVQEQQCAWLVRNSISSNRAIRDMEERFDKRLEKTEKEITELLSWKNNFSGKSAVAATLLLLCVSSAVYALGKAVVDKLMGHQP